MHDIRNREDLVVVGIDDSGDAGMLELFQAELESHLPVLSEGLLALEKDGDHSKWFEALMRAAHSIKGAARIVGVDVAVRVAHVLEDCFVAAQSGQVRLGPTAVDSLLRGVDILGKCGRANAIPISSEDLTAVLDAIVAIREQGLATQVACGPSTIRSPDLTAEGCDHLRRALVERRQRGTTAYTLDCTDVRDVMPVGVALLAQFARQSCVNGSRPHLEVTHADAEVRRIFRLTGLAAWWTLPAAGAFA